MQILCPKCAAIGQLFYTSTWVDRRSLWLGSRCMEYRFTPVPLCRCRACKRRIRVLPVEIPSFKHCTWKVIETSCSAYIDTQLPNITLRRTVGLMGCGHPHSSTLHGWLGSIGERAFGRLDHMSGCLPVNALIAETAKRLDNNLLRLWGRRYSVAEHKYKSEKRAEQLEGCARVFSTATHLFPKTAHPFSQWEEWLQTHLHVAAWSFPARVSCTTFQQHASCRDSIELVLSTKNHRKTGKEKNHGARSPP